jgi:hypothetical protein
VQSITADVHQLPRRMKLPPISMACDCFVDGSDASQSHKKNHNSCQQISRPAQDPAQISLQK